MNIWLIIDPVKCITTCCYSAYRHSATFSSRTKLELLGLEHCILLNLVYSIGPSCTTTTRSANTDLEKNVWYKRKEIYADFRRCVPGNCPKLCLTCQGFTQSGWSNHVGHLLSVHIGVILDYLQHRQLSTESKDAEPHLHATVSITQKPLNWGYQFFYWSY